MQVNLSTNNASNQMNDQALESIYWVIGPALATGTPPFAFGVVAIVILVEDLKKNATMSKKLILCLIVSDLIGTWGMLFKLLITFLNSHKNSVLCTFVHFLILYFYLLSGAIATTMSIERCLALRAPYWYARKMLGNQIFVPLGLTAGGLIAVCLLPVFGVGSVYEKKIVNEEEVIFCRSFPDEQVPTSTEVTFPMTFAAVLTLMILVNVSCNMVAMEAMRKMRRVIPWYNEIQTPTEEFKMTKMLMSLSIAFIVCLTPLVGQLVFTQVGVFSPSWLKILIQTLSACNYTIDPCIYLFFNKKYRQRFRKFCCPN